MIATCPLPRLSLPGPSPKGMRHGDAPPSDPGRAAGPDPAFRLRPHDAGRGPGARAQVRVGSATLAVAGPSGFCLDEPATRIDRDGAFVLLGDCGLLGKGPAVARPKGAVLTASLDASGAGSVAEIRRLAETAAGRALVGQSGSGARVRVLATRETGGAVFLLVEDQGRKPVPGLKSRFWRGFLGSTAISPS